METPLQITVRGLAHSAALDARIREDAAKLDESHPQIMSCRVTVEETRKRRSKGRQFQVRIDVRVPGSAIVANHDHDQDPYVALRNAFHAVRRQLEAALQRGHVKKHDSAAQEE